MISRKSAQLPLDAGRNKRPEVRISLRTKHPALARRIASWANARLEAAVSMEDLQRTIDSLKANLCTWTIENGRISTDGTPEDSESLSKFLKEHPDALQATRVQGISNDELAQRMNAHYEATVARWNGSTPGSASSDAKPSTLLNRPGFRGGRLV